MAATVAAAPGHGHQPIGADDATDLIRRLAAWVSFLLFPPGKERLPYDAAVAGPWPTRPLPLPRSPYGRDTPSMPPPPGLYGRT